MRWLLRIGAGIVLFLLILIGAVMLASESGEVVVLTTADGATTRLWVVDHDGSAWLRSGDPGSAWFQRINSNAAVEVERNGKRFAAKVAPDVAYRDLINALMRQKYGAADWFIDALLGRGDATPIRLER